MNKLHEPDHSVGAPARERCADPSAARASILMVDDQPARLLTYESILSGLQIHCVRALSGNEALERLLAQEFAVILLDVSMPGMDGFELARLIREHPRLESTPIIFITGVHVSALDQLKGYEVGAIDYISVPVVPEILRSKVALLVELHQRRRELHEVNAALAEARRRLDSEHADTIVALRDSEQRLRELANNIDQIVWTCDKLGTPTWYNQRWYEFTGATPEEMHDGAWERVFDPAHLSRVRASLEECLRTGRTWQDTYRMRARDGQYRWFLGRAIPIRDETGRVLRWFGTGTDITEQKTLHEALQAADRRKDEFLAMLAHELRNPVAPISNAAEGLARLLAPDRKTKPLVEIIQRQTAHLARLLDDLLDVARITQGRIELRNEVVSVASCIEPALEAAQPLIREKGHQVVSIQTLEPLYVKGDKVRLAQCFANVLVNAAKYTRQHGEIRIKPYEDNGFAVIEISDNGIGIAPELLTGIFELFAQGERSLDRSQGGLGIGLAVCRQLLTMQGGSIAAVSEGVGHGTTITMRIPLAEAPQPSGVATAPLAGQGHRILIVDDNQDAADSLAMLLELSGHQTRAAYSGDAALESAGAFDPHIVLLDIGLPGLDGYEVARRMKRAGQPPRLIALSGYGRPEDKRQSAAAGFDLHLVKPIDIDALNQAITAVAAGP